MSRAKAKKARWGALLGAMALGGGTVLAQGPAPAPPPASMTTQVVMPVQQESNISPDDMLTQTTDALNQMNTNLTHIVQLHQVALDKKDVIKVNCIKDKLDQDKQLIGIGQDASTQEHADIASGDDSDRYHQYSRIKIVEGQSQVLDTEAANCIGQDLTYVGATKVTVSVDPSVVGNDPTQQQIPNPVIEHPPEVSPF
jgi:hypothetical protein